MPLKFKIKNWKLATLAMIFICLFASLGCWQLWRAKQKQILLNAFALRTQLPPLTVDGLKSGGSPLKARGGKDLRFYRVTLTGRFDNQHSLLLDNKIFRGQVGYEVYTPFIAEGLDMPILVDRGFLPLGANRQQLPGLHMIIGKVTLVGILNIPPAYVSFSNMSDFSPIRWPLRVEFIHLATISKLLNAPLFQYIISLEPQHEAAYPIEWQAVSMHPERHKGYAVQWFALALALLILLIVLNREQSN